MSNILCIPADNTNKLFLKDFRVDKDKAFIKYKSTYNDIPWREIELGSDGNGNATICGDDGTVLFRFSLTWLEKL